MPLRQKHSERWIMAKRNIIPIFIPFAGCPVKCIYCDQNQITGVSSTVSGEDVGRKIAVGLEKCAHQPAEVAFYGGTFTMLDIKKQNELLRALRPFIKSGRVSAIRLSTRPEKLNEEDFIRLKSFGVTTVEFGIQSVDGRVLEAAGRGISVEEMDRTVFLAKASGLEVGLQQMVGLPEDSFEKDLVTARWIADRGDFVRIYPTVVFRNTALYSMYVNGEFKPLSLKEAIERVAQLLDFYDTTSIPVIRAGLPQMARSAYVAGPYHDNFREFAESFRRLSPILKKYKDVESVEGSQRAINRLAGPFGYGRKALEAVYGPVAFRKRETVEEELQINGEEHTHAFN